MTSPRRYVGVMTGNSMDAADAALVGFDDDVACRLLATAREPIDDDLAAALKALAESETVNVADMLGAQTALTEVCARAALRLGANAEATVIGCHGQTLAHRPALGATWQLLDGALLAERTGMDVVCDFRARDIASGGEGAPLAPLFHRHLFGARAPCDVVNIGGIANITHVRPDGDVRGYDIGPGMLLSDALCQSRFGRRFDRDGAIAASGKVNEAWLEWLLSHPYFRRQPPKSCGREEFSAPRLLAGMPDMSPEDAQATALEMTARIIADSLRAPMAYLCGGGARNTTLTRRLRDLHPDADWRLSDDIGVAAEWMEATAFAWLAKCRIERLPLATTSITGGQPRIAGASYPR